jgi:hypothetical protein
VKHSPQNPLTLNLAIDSKGGLLPMDPTVKRFNTPPLEFLSREQMQNIHSTALQVPGDHATVIHHQKRKELKNELLQSGFGN